MLKKKEIIPKERERVVTPESHQRKMEEACLEPGLISQSSLLHIPTVCLQSNLQPNPIGPLLRPAFIKSPKGLLILKVPADRVKNAESESLGSGWGLGFYVLISALRGHQCCWESYIL